MKMKSIVLSALLILGAVSCQDDEFQSSEEQKSLTPMDYYIGEMGLKSALKLSITPEFLTEINEKMAEADQSLRVLKAEFITAYGSDEIGQTVWAKHVGNKQMGSDFVPNDPRGWWNDPDLNKINYAIDQTIGAIPPGGGLSLTETNNAIHTATYTWADLPCSKLDLIYKFTSTSQPIGFTAGISDVYADVQHAGWRFYLQSGVLGVTITWFWADTDIDNNGKRDVAFREIYYNRGYMWTVDHTPGIDVESIALHELGHGFSQAHFGKIITNNNGETKAIPRAVMNSMYFGPYRELQGTDVGGHCSNWAEWPNN